MSHLNAILGIVAVIIFSGVVAVWKALWPYARVRRAMKKLPLRKAAALVEGEYCVVVGTAEAGETAQRAPSGRPCVVFATRLRSRGDDDGEVYDASGSVGDFIVVDDAVRVRVVPGGALRAELRTTATVSVVPKTDHGHAGFGASIIQRNLATAAIDDRASEGIVAPGQRIAVAGRVVKDAADGTLRLVGELAQPVLVTDRGLALR